MSPLERFKVFVAGAALLIGVVMLGTPGPAGPVVPWLVTGFCVLVVAADLLEERAERKADRESDDEQEAAP